MAKSILEVVLQGVDKLSGPVRQAGESVKDFEKRTKASSAKLKKFGATALKATATLAALGVIVKKTFDLAKEGAAIKQTGQSFGFLMEKVGASSDTLAQLRAASKGTISDLDLMSSTSTLLAGAQGELGVQMAKATPQLMSIAKAAQKLNPSLGDTTFLYNSLALGIKRGSPLILDNLGLLVSVGDANKKLAAALGKTVAELTSEEQKLALLNETMRAGNVLVDQAGGTTDSATDSYVQLGAASSNLTDIFKVLLHEGFEPVVSASADVAMGMVEQAQAAILLQDAVEKGMISQEKGIFVMYRGRVIVHDLNAALGLLEKAELDAAREASGLTEKLANASGSMFSFATATKFVAEATPEATRAVAEFSKVLDNNLAIALGETTPEIVAGKLEMAMYRQEFLDAAGDSPAMVQKQKELAQSFLTVALGVRSAEKALVLKRQALKDAVDEVDEFTVAVDESTRVQEGWAKMQEESAIRAGTTTREIIDAQKELAELTIRVEAAGFANLELNEKYFMLVEALGLLEDAARSASGAMEELHESTVDWGQMNEWAALRAGELTQEVIDNKAELERLTGVMDRATHVTLEMKAEWLEAKKALDESTSALTVNTGGLRDNTAAKEDNRLATERANEITDLYRIMTGAATQATVDLEQQIDEATAAYSEMGDASGFTADEIANLRFTLLGMNDILREQTRVTTSNVSALDNMTEAARRSWQQLSELGTVMPGMRGGAPGGEYEGEGGAERFAQEQGWQVSAGGRDQEEHAKQVLGQIAAQHSGVWEGDGDMSGWVKEFMMSGAGTGLAAGFSESVIDAAIKDQEYAHAQGAHGLSGIVPGGYPNDSFMIGATSGESVNITPAHMRGRGGGGMVINTVNVYGVQTSSQLFEAVTQAARQRGRDFAKVM
jgi:hypothetical protein